MTKAELVDKVAATIQLPKYQTETVVTLFLQCIMDALGEGDSDSAGVSEGAKEAVGIGDGDSCPIAAQIEAKAIRIATLSLFVMLLVAALYERRINSTAVIDRRYS